ncbi:MAG: hypothetical protein HY692_03360, partial [Cyanobacteria bacterium NC_groundwater_1444_Ag_S-0.65um_54_12]|nr:hypothetical protein [Cyanobacteria bacterium NC_groundwater_1444_Ag_S-0.65um_54_12]
MAISATLLPQLLDSACRLWDEVEDLRAFARGVAKAWSKILGQEDVFIAFRDDAARPWRVFAAVPDIEADFAERLPAFEPGDETFWDDRRWHPTALPVPRPLTAYLFTINPLPEEFILVRHLLASSIASYAFGQRAVRADLLVGQVARKLHALQLLTLNINNSYDLKALSFDICTI